MKDRHHLELVKRENIVVTNGELKNPTLLMSLDTLMKQSFEADVAYQLGKLVRRLQVIADSFDAEGKAIISKYCKKDEKGNPKFITEKQLKKVKNKEGKEEEKEVDVPIGWDYLGDTPEEINATEDKVEKETEILYYKKYPIDVYKFSRTDFLGARLTYSQWLSLTPFLQNPVTSEDQAPISSEVPDSPSS